jgi:acetate kinase
MCGVDLIIFSGGIGENSPKIRSAVCEGLEFMGLEFDFKKNEGLKSKEAVISKPGSKITVMVVPTNEELVIAEDTMRIVSEMSGKT